jgi:hypothetical protein
VKTEVLPTWVKVVCSAGVLLGIYLLCSGLTANIVNSEHALRPGQFFLQLCCLSIAALPLLLRWRTVTASLFRHVLLFLLVADAIYFSYHFVAAVVWAIHHGERTHVVCYSVIGFLAMLTIVSQFPAVLHLTRTRESKVA